MRVEYTTLPKVPKFISPAVVGSAVVPAAVPSLDAHPRPGKPGMTIAAARRRRFHARNNGYQPDGPIQRSGR